MTRFILRRFGTSWLLIVLPLLLLMFGCDEAGTSTDGGGSGGGAVANDPSEVDFDASVPAIENALTNLPPEYAYISLFSDLFFDIFVVYVEYWDGTETYAYGTTTITVDHDGDVWTWTYIDSVSLDTIVYRIEKTSAGWVFSWTINGVLYLSGSIADDGLTGEIIFYDIDTEETVFLYQLTTIAGPYAIQVTAVSYTDGVPGDSLLIQTTNNGSSGTWAYRDVSHPVNNASGSW